MWCDINKEGSLFSFSDPEITLSRFCTASFATTGAGVGAMVAVGTAGAVVAAGAAAGASLGVAVASSPQAAITAIIPINNQRGLNNQRLYFSNAFMNVLLRLPVGRAEP